MKWFESPIFGKVACPASLEELFRLIRATPEGVGRVRLWRGQSDISWPIHSSAYRKLALGEPTPSETSMVWYESDLLDRASHKGFRQLDGRLLTDFELLARLQHHGAATRLIDATGSAVVALFFSAAANPKSTGALFGFHADFLGGFEGMPLKVSYEEQMAGIAKFRHPQTWEPTAVSPRVAAQHSSFVYSAVSPSPTGSLAIDPSPEAFLAVAITPRFKQEVLQILSDVFDVRHVTLFPDIDGFGHANSYRFDRSNAYRW